MDADRANGAACAPIASSGVATPFGPITTPATAAAPTASTHPGRHPEPDEGPGLTWRETGANYWSGSWGSQPRGIVMLETSGLWVAYVRLEDPAGLSPITTVGRFDTVEAAQVATDEVWASR